MVQVALTNEMDTAKIDKVSATSKYVVVAADYRDNEFDDIFMSQSRKEQMEMRRRQQHTNKRQWKLAGDSFDFRKYHSIFEIKCFTLRVERWRKPRVV